MADLAQRTADGNVCAWVDANDSFDPESAAANGVGLKQLLWVRCRNSSSDQSERTSQKFPAAIDNKPWTRLDQVIRATDLLLQAGGFAAIVLDLADVAVKHASRIPLATWFRFKQAADRTRCSLIVLGKAPYAQSSAAVVIECRPMRAETAGDTVLRGFTFTVQRAGVNASLLSRSAGAHKLTASTWFANAAWRGMKINHTLKTLHAALYAAEFPVDCLLPYCIRIDSCRYSSCRNAQQTLALNSYGTKTWSRWA